MIDFLLKKFEEKSDSVFIVWKNREYDYSWLIRHINKYKEIFKDKIKEGSVTALEGDFTPVTISLFLAFTELNYIIVPRIIYSNKDKKKLYKIAEVEYEVTVNSDDDFTVNSTGYKAEHAFYQTIRKRRHPGLVLFTSGTSGEPKAAVHDFSKLLDKFRIPRQSLKTINFLLFDHWGGLNTMLHSLSNTSTVITLTDRSPDSVCKTIEEQKIEILPASPTFLNLMIFSEAYKHYDLSSLKIISYGTEPMPESLLKKLNKIFPEVKIQQTYGLIELGVLRAKSKSNDSLWVKIGGEGFQTRVVDGILQIKAESAMLGYLNAPSPFTEDGWFNTGDAVEVDGEYYKILGRKSELINVGGEKVYPAEVESVIREIQEVSDVTVYGEKNPITGNIVCAKVNLKNIETDEKKIISLIKKYCRERMKSFMVPVKVFVVKESLHGERFKKVRSEKATN